MTMFSLPESNLADATSLWVSIGRANGSVTTSENVPDPAWTDYTPGRCTELPRPAPARSPRGGNRWGGSEMKAGRRMKDEGGRMNAEGGRISSFILPPSSFPRRRRPGVSILEVIFAILVTTIGLLAALTVFPVAAAIAKKGRIADETAVSGRAAVHIFDAKGMRRPDMWIGWSQVWETRPSPPAPAPQPGFHSVPNIGFFPSTAFCIDPRFVAVNAEAGDPPADRNAASIFPYVQTAVVAGPRMFRIGLTNGVPGGTLMSKVQADSVFTFADEQTVTRPPDGSLPAFGSFAQGDSNNDGTPDFMTTRNTSGHLSWMATLAPKHELYAPGVVASELYVLSIVVFNDRPLVNFTFNGTPLDPAPAVTSPPDTQETMYNLAERMAEVDFVDAGGLGYAGGETYLIWPPDGSSVANTYQAEASRALKVRAGDWIMLSGLASGARGASVPVFKWYRVTEADHEAEYHTAEQHYAVAVSLSGPDWDTTLGFHAGHARDRRRRRVRENGAAGIGNRILDPAPVGGAGARGSDCKLVIANCQLQIEGNGTEANRADQRDQISILQFAIGNFQLLERGIEAVMTTRKLVKKPATLKSKRKKRGIVLLVVVSLLAIFILMGVAFAMVAMHYRKTAEQMPSVGRYGDPAEREFELVMGQLLYDTNMRSSLRLHSLLHDLYGIDTVAGTISAVPTALDAPPGLNLAATPPQQPQVWQFEATVAPGVTFNPAPGYYSGRVLTFLSGNAAGHSTRVLEYAYNSTTGVYAFAVEAIESKGPSILQPAGGNQFIINGAPFNGAGAGFNATSGAMDATYRGRDVNQPAGTYLATYNLIALLPHFAGYDLSFATGGTASNPVEQGGLDESWDTPDYQNMYMAMVPPTAAGGGVPIIPSFHRPELVNFWRNRTNGSARVQRTARCV